MITMHFMKMLHSGLYTNVQQQGMWASYYMLACCRKHSSEKLHPVYTCRNAAKTQMQPMGQEVLFDMTGLQAGPVAGSGV